VFAKKKNDISMCYFIFFYGTREKKRDVPAAGILLASLAKVVTTGRERETHFKSFLLCCDDGKRKEVIVLPMFT
jgi:hypothetical protein